MPVIGVASSSILIIASSVFTLGHLFYLGIKEQNYSTSKSNLAPILGLLCAILGLLASIYSLFELNDINKLLFLYFIIVSILNIVVSVNMLKKKQIKASLAYTTIVADIIPVIIAVLVGLYLLIEGGGGGL